MPKYFFLPVLFSLSIFKLSAQLETTSKTPVHLGSEIQFYSQLLKDSCKINVYLPTTYNNSDTTRYPVVYLLDGAITEDFIHIVGIYHFYSFEWINYLKSPIIVGIVSTDRRKNYTFKTRIQTDSIRFPTSGRSDQFTGYIEQELQPYIDKTYKTNGEKTLIGQSLGGLLAANVLITKPWLFSKYLIISPSIWWDNGSLLQKNISAIKTLQNKTKVYIGVGKEGLSPSITPRWMEKDAKLLYQKISGAGNKYLSVYFDYLPQENHATILHQAVINGIKIFNRQ